MMLCDQFGDTVENTGARQYAKHGHQLAKVTGLTNPAGPKETASSLTTSSPAPILTSVDAAVHSEALASDISGEITQQRINHRTLIG